MIPPESNAFQVPLDIKSELEEYRRSGNRQELLNVLRDQFLINRHGAAARAEDARTLAIEVLFNRIPHMSENMLVRVIDTLAQAGAIDMQAIMGALPDRGPMPSLTQQFATAGGQQLAGNLGGNAENNPVRQTGQVLEAIEHISNYLKTKTIDRRTPADEKYNP